MVSSGLSLRRETVVKGNERVVGRGKHVALWVPKRLLGRRGAPHLRPQSVDPVWSDITVSSP